jgi:ATP-dependent exoDNAse (exonuclease V) beta subunit
MSVSDGLNIFKASAGSGKTFRLVGEYLKLLFVQPFSYRNILAVTFTNKATAEMKERILKELAHLSGGGESKYLEFLKENGSESKIRERATFLLKLILHDYSRFSVMTIDSFFQKIIRSFAREIRLNASFRTEIDHRQALEDAVDLLFQEIDSNDLLKTWMIMFLEENLEEGRSWDFRKELLKFGREVEKEAFKIHGDKLLEALSEKEKLSSYVFEMKRIISDAEIRLNQIGQEGLNLLGQSGLTQDQLKGGKNSFANIFNKLVGGKIDPPTQTMLDACDHVENWYKKTDSPQTKEQIEKLFQNGMNRLLNEAVQASKEEIPKINSAQAILKNIYPFGLLGNIALKMKEVLSEANTVLLSDSGTLIGRIITGSDTPFIYEKVGLIYRHFMLDEFQDTSKQQWTNFKPLVENALASGNSSLVVGDVKQSIYRWRNGDWNLLESQLASDLSHQHVYTERLDINWRSKKNIVDFNNTLFQRASIYLNDFFDEELKDQSFTDLSGVISKAYADQYQKCSKNDASEGYVKMTFLDGEGATKKSEFRDKALVVLIDQLELVQHAGVKAEEITILVRENSEAEKVAKALWERKKTGAKPGCVYDVITSDTLKIGQSPVVRFVVNFFKMYSMKEPQVTRAEILYAYYVVLRPLIERNAREMPIDYHELFDSNSPLPELFKEWLEVNPPSDFLTGQLALPLFELAVSIAGHFKLGDISGEKVYLQAFLDMILEYGREDSGGIPGFIEWWESIGSAKTLNLPTLKNFIRISSIHQSKGLEYHTVFIPFCNWEIGLSSYKLPHIWSIPESEPFNLLNIVLLKCDKNLRNSIFSHDYYQELLFSLMDNLNLLYVAMTRAINNLFIILPYKEGIKQAVSVAEMIQNLVESPFLGDSIDRDKYMDLGQYWDPFNKIFESGSIVSSPGAEMPIGEKGSDDRLTLNSNGKRMAIRSHSKDYFQITGNRQTERINKGTLMHQVFEKIITPGDLGLAIEQMVSSGQLSIQEGDEIFAKMDGLLKQAPFADWFSSSWKVLNERDILRAGESKHRPDRVLLKDGAAIVIDYKTGEKSDKDIRQMKGYLSDLRKMGYASCEGNIWYLRENEITKVELA